MTLCEQCASIDPDAHADPKADWDAGRYLAYRKNHKVIAELKHSRDMSKSAHNGCEGCRFFLDVVAQKCKNLDAFIDGAIGILITHHPGAYEIKSRTGRVSHFSIPVDLCLASKSSFPALGTRPLMRRSVSTQLSWTAHMLTLPNWTEGEMIFCDQSPKTHRPRRVLIWLCPG